MEHTLRAGTDGVVGDVLVHVGDRVALNQLLAVVEPTQHRRGGMMDFDLSPEHEAFREVVRDFAEGEIAPHAAQWDEDHNFPAGDR